MRAKDDLVNKYFSQSWLKPLGMISETVFGIGEFGPSIRKLRPLNTTLFNPKDTNIAKGIIANVPELLGPKINIEISQVGRKTFLFVKQEKIPRIPNTAKRFENGSSVKSKRSSGTQKIRECIPVLEAETKVEKPCLSTICNHQKEVRIIIPIPTAIVLNSLFIEGSKNRKPIIKLMIVKRLVSGWLRTVKIINNPNNPTSIFFPLEKKDNPLYKLSMPKSKPKERVNPPPIISQIKLRGRSANAITEIQI